MPRERSAFNHTLIVVCQKYWILKAFVAVRGVINNCPQCRHRNAKSDQEIMAELPSPRMQLELPPFSHVGGAYFEPLLVRQQPSDVKHYGWLSFHVYDYTGSVFRISC